MNDAAAEVDSEVDSLVTLTNEHTRQTVSARLAMLEMASTRAQLTLHLALGAPVIVVRSVDGLGKAFYSVRGNTGEAKPTIGFGDTMTDALALALDQTRAVIYRAAVAAEWKDKRLAELLQDIDDATVSLKTIGETT